MITYTEQTALIVVDMQHDFADPTGSLYVKGGEELVEPIALEIEAALQAGAPVVFTQDWHPAETPHFGEDAWPVHCVRYTPGAQIVPGLPVVNASAVIRKGQGTADGYSAFDTDELDAFLKDNEITTLVVVGLAGDFCVKATAIDGAKLGYQVIAPPSLTRYVNRGGLSLYNTLSGMIAVGVEFTEL